MGRPTRRSETSRRTRNVDEATVEGFGAEWARFDNAALTASERAAIFDQYFAQFPWDELPPNAHGFDAGCGSGRWARLVAPRVGHLHCVDASEEALTTARTQLADMPNCTFHHASVSQLPFAPKSMDFGYSLGVLHHTPDPADGLRHCVQALRPGAPFLLYLYYRFDNRPAWFRLIWRTSDLARKAISHLPKRVRFAVCDILALTVYWPLARLARLVELTGRPVDRVPLAFYRRRSFYVMRNDALDRFGTRTEHRFTRSEMRDLMESAGLEHIRFNTTSPYWCALGVRASTPTEPAPAIVPKTE